MPDPWTTYEPSEEDRSNNQHYEEMRRYYEVMEHIDAAGFDVSSFDADFLEDILGTYRNLSEKQKTHVRCMAQKYLGEEI